MVPEHKLLLSASSDISRTTPDNQVFYSMTTDCFVAMGRESVAFRARANTDIHIALGSEDSPSSGTHYEIIIGGWNNTQSAIRYGIGGTTCVSESGTPLSQSYFDEFWFSWNGSYVYVGTGSSPGNGTFMTCYHLTPYTINFIWIMTGWNSSGEWRFPNGLWSQSPILLEIIQTLKLFSMMNFIKTNQN